MSGNTNFKVARIRAGVTQMDLAEKTNIPKTRIVRFETGRVDISRFEEERIQIAVALKCHPSALDG